MSVSFPQWGKFAAIISSDKCSALFYLFSFWEPYNANVKFLVLSHKSLKVSTLFKMLFSFAALSEWALLLYLPACWFFFFRFISLLLNPVSVFFFFSSVTVFFSSVTSVWDFLVFSVSVKILTVFNHSSPEFSEHIYEHYFELFIRKITYLRFIKVFFWDFVLFFHLEYIPFPPNFIWLSVFVSVY